RKREEAEAQEFGLDEPSSPSASGSRNAKPKKSIADLAYRKAKAIKSAERLRAAGKIVSLPKAGGRAAAKKPKQHTPSRSREMKDLFQADVAKGKGGEGQGEGQGGKRRGGEGWRLIQEQETVQETVKRGCFVRATRGSEGGLVH
ncbi:hypothetical protein CLOM_g6704, partial [Closterium sp. NIES-68]